MATSPVGEQPREPGLRIRLDISALPPAQAAGLFQLARVGDTVELLIATMPLLRIAQAMEGKEEDSELDAQLTARYQMSLSAFVGLHKRINELYDKIPSGVLAHAKEDGPE